MTIKYFKQMPDRLKNYVWFVWDTRGFSSLREAAKSSIRRFKDKYGILPEVLYYDKKKKHIWLWHRDMRQAHSVFVAGGPKKRVEYRETTEENKGKQVKRGGASVVRRHRIKKTDK